VTGIVWSAKNAAERESVIIIILLYSWPCAAALHKAGRRLLRRRGEMIIIMIQPTIIIIQRRREEGKVWKKYYNIYLHIAFGVFGLARSRRTNLKKNVYYIFCSLHGYTFMCVCKSRGRIVSEPRLRIIDYLYVIIAGQSCVHHFNSIL